MLLVGDIRAYPNGVDEDMCILNLSSLYEGLDRVLLAPSIQPMLNDEKNFDIEYANYIFSNDNKFVELMKIMIPLYLGTNVFLAVTRNEETYDIVTESLCKLIQQRYGYNYQLINSPDDINWYDQSGFSASGIQLFDQDRDRYVMIMQMNGNGVVIDDNY